MRETDNTNDVYVMFWYKTVFPGDEKSNTSFFNFYFNAGVCSRTLRTGFSSILSMHMPAALVSGSPDIRIFLYQG